MSVDEQEKYGERKGSDTSVRSDYDDDDDRREFDIDYEHAVDDCHHHQLELAVRTKHGGAAASLPAPEEVFAASSSKSSRSSFTRRVQRMMDLAVVMFVLAAVVIGISVGVTSKSKNNQSNDVAADVERKSTPDEIITFLLDRNITSFDDLDKMDSVQNKAVLWLANADPANLAVPQEEMSVHDDDDEDDVYMYVFRYVMVVNYYALSGDTEWIKKHSFLSKRHVCEWNGFDVVGGAIRPAGVVCDHQKTNRVPVALHLDNNGAKGTIPTENGMLTSLKWFDVSNSRISGSIPTELCKLHKLHNLTVTDNHLTGELPACLGHWHELEMLLVSNNLIEGTLPHKLSNSKAALKRLAMDDNLFTGDPLPVWNQLTNLELLFADGNSLEGTIDDDFLADHLKLRQLDLSSNNFTLDSVTGLPKHLFSMPQLDTLDLSSNKLKAHTPSDRLPKENKKLKFLSLHNNELGGNIPKKFHDLVALEHLDLSNNHFGGSMHTEFGNMTSLKYFFLSNNEKFHGGAIPDTFANLVNLEELSLRNTNRTEALPKWLGSMSKLKLLDLGSNSMTGKIPKEYGALSHLQYLLLNGNQGVHGEVPTEMSNANKLIALFLDGTKIQGEVVFLCDAVDDLELIFIECNSTIPMVDCDCCKCCHRKEDSSCSDPFLSILDASWENGFQRTTYDFYKDGKK